ncbi:MAG TPA: methionyl-tRNA formyltransferase [Thermoanaerobaculia bacterium]
MATPGRIVFFGTPEFAVPTLAALVAAGRAPACVVAQPARPAGRGRGVEEPPVARWAAERGFPILQPERVREPAFLAALGELALDVVVVVAFGQIFPPGLLALPPLGCVNLHASLLPRYRGAAPIQAAIAAGEAKTGVTTMRMEQGLDSGPILLQDEVTIGPRETAGELGARLARLGARLTVETLARLERGDLAPRPQDGGLATYAPRLSRASGEADWSLSALALFDRLRAYTPWPGMTASLRGRPVKVLWGEPLGEAPRGAGETAAPPGTVLGLREARIAVACGGGTVFGVERLQRAGKPPRAAADFANGERLAAGERFG